MALVTWTAEDAIVVIIICEFMFTLFWFGNGLLARLPFLPNKCEGIEPAKVQWLVGWEKFPRLECTSFVFFVSFYLVFSGWSWELLVKLVTSSWSGVSHQKVVRNETPDDLFPVLTVKCKVWVWVWFLLLNCLIRCRWCNKMKGLEKTKNQKLETKTKHQNRETKTQNKTNKRYRK